MTTKMRSLRIFRNPIGCLILLAALGAAAGCSTAETTGGSGTNMNHVLPSGSSVAGWLVIVPSGGSHASTATLDYIANGGSSGCTECHGSDLSGGISGKSCFATDGCHHTPAAVPNWATPAVHGATAKKAPGSSGFASCQICHGNNFSGGGSQVACADCHGVPAPHPAAPWRGPTFTHTTTNTANATVCAQCHFPGSPNNPANHPATPAPAGTSPGCFNNTLCHGEAVPHPVGSTWVATSPAAQPHGNSAKATPGTTTGFSYCQVCHGTGTNFSGGSSGTSCYPCHGASSPHASQWNSTDTYKHSTTDTGNAAVCAYCHRNTNPGTPDCFNNTLCHGAGGVPHPVGGAWFAFPPEPQAHGNAAKATPGATQGFSYCQVCHGTGTNFDGGSSGVSCYTTCHFVSDTPPLVTPPYPPHPVAPWRASAGSAYTHTSTDPGNAAVCAQCHRNSNPGTPGCFNSTLCHAGGAAHPVPYNSDSHYTVTSATFPGSCSACHSISAPSVGPACQTCHVAASPLAAANCTSCHGDPPSGAAYANIAGAHGVHVAMAGAGTPVSCDTCHTGLGPSLLNLNHYNRAKSRVQPGDVVFSSGYLAETGTRSFDNVSTSGTYLTCNAVSCHGGQRTPNWQTGTLNVNDQCTVCHVSGTTQYNSYISGRHTLHVNPNALGTNATACKFCHNTVTLAVSHFTNLGTPAMEGPASATIGGGSTLIPAGNYIPATGSCSPNPGSCHGTETW